MDASESTADDTDSNFSSGSDQELADSDSSPERARSSRVPALALGIAPSLDQANQQRPVMPAVKTSATRAQDNIDSKEQPAKRQPFALPRLSLQTDQAMTRGEHGVPGTSALEAAEASGRDQQELPPYRTDAISQTGRQQPMFTVQLASEAFSIESGALQESTHSSMSQAQVVKHFCASQLGLKSSAIRMFELHEVTSSEAFSEGCIKLAIAVDGSEFSLSAYEGMLREMKQLRTDNQSMTKSLTSVRHLVDQQTQDLGASVEKLKNLTDELKDQVAHNQKLQKEVALQRRRLEQSDASRLQGQNNLDQLKADFDNLSAYVSRSSSLDPSSPPQRSGSLKSVPAGSPVTRKLSTSSSCFPDGDATDKMFKMLESLRNGDETILSKVQQLIDMRSQGKIADNTPA